MKDDAKPDFPKHWETDYHRLDGEVYFPEHRRLIL